MKLLACFLIVVFLISGCSSVKTYTYKQDRVDQDVKEGNKGYLVGTPPQSASREGLKRDMIGVDVEVPVLPWEKKKISVPPRIKGEEVEITEEKVIYEIPAKKSAPKRIKGEMIEEDEEEWIK